MDDTAAAATTRERTWFRLWEVVPSGWRIGELTWDPALAQFVLTAMSPRRPGRGSVSDRFVTARGASELTVVSALRDLLTAQAAAAD